MKVESQINQMSIDAVKGIIDVTSVSEFKEVLDDMFLCRLTHHNDMNLSDREDLVNIYYSLSLFLDRVKEVESVVHMIKYA